MSQQFTLTARKAHSLQDCIGQSVANRSRQVTLTLCSVLVRYIQSTAYISGLHSTRGVDILEQLLRRVMSMTKRLEHLSYKERPRKLELFSMEKRKFRCIFLTHLLDGSRKEDRDRLFAVVASDRTRSNMHELKYRKFHLNMLKTKTNKTQKTFITVVEHWNRLPRDAVASPFWIYSNTWP